MSSYGASKSAHGRITRALLLSPHDLSLSNMRRAIAFSYFIAGRYAEAISASEVITPIPQNAIFGLATVAACAALLGRQADAERAIEETRVADPSLRLANLRERFPMTRKEDFNRWKEGMRKAGLPE